MTEKNLGRAGGFMCFGEVLNRDDDPTQTGKCKVKWNIGGINQSQLGEDDLPWSSILSPSSNPNLKNIGTPQTGLMKGSKVVGFSPSGDGQDVIILGSMPSAGKGGTDGTKDFKSDIPIPAQSQENGGQSQGSYGDKNGVVTENSIVQYGQDEGGNGAAQFAKINEPIGTLGHAIT